MQNEETLGLEILGFEETNTSFWNSMNNIAKG
jgi:hypothetical protein